MTLKSQKREYQGVFVRSGFAMIVRAGTGTTTGADAVSTLPCENKVTAHSCVGWSASS